jgi:hypothetical protein
MGSSATQRGTGSQFGAEAYGLFVGVTTFQDPTYSKHPLPQAQRDATGVADVLRSRLGWKPANIEVLAGTVTKAAIRDRFLHIRKRIAEAKECDLFLLFVSTHGHIYERVRRGKTTTLLATDTLLHDPLVLADTGLTPDILGAYVDSIPARQKLIISDACFASSGMSAADISPPETYRDIDAAVLSAAVGRSYAPDQDAPSLFSGHLIEILQHMEGEVGLGTVFDLISRSIPKDVQIPYLETHARYIVLGVVTGTVVAERVASFDDIIRFAEATFQFTLGRFLSDGWSESNYVHRLTLEQKFKSYLEGEDLDIFSVVGGAGTGKTTALLYLAQQARRDNFPVFWFSHVDLSTYPTPTSALVGSLQGLDKSLTADNVENLLQGKRPLVVFFDAVNEWSTDSSQLAHFYMELKNASARNLRIVIACRDEAWPTIATHISGSLPKDMVAKPAYRLDNFDDREFEEVRQRYSKIFFGDVQILRHPLFLRLILDLKNVSDASGSGLFYSVVLIRYLDLKLSKIEHRYGLIAQRTMRAIEDLMHVFEQRRTQALATIEFLQVVSDVVGSALLEEGLVRRTGDLIAIENEIIHQFLLSRILPSDPFASDEWRDRSFSDPWWGASAFKLLEIPETGRIEEIMRDLLAWEPAAVLYVLNVLARIDDLSPFRNVLLSLSEDARIFDTEILEFISTLLNRRESEELPLVIALLRLLFLDTLQDWRLMDWSDSSPRDFRWKMSNLERSAAHVLLRCMDTYPSATIKALIEIWLLDSTTLADGEAHIRDVAYVFLLYVGLDRPEVVANAVEQASGAFHQGTESGGLLHRIIRAGAAASPEIFIPRIPAWFKSASLRSWTGTIIAATPESHASDVIDSVRVFISDRATEDSEIASMLMALGSVPSPSVLKFFREEVDVPEYQTGIVQGCIALREVFPAEVDELIGPLSKRPVLRDDVMAALVSFFRSHVCSIPDLAAPVFARATLASPAVYELDIAMSISRCSPNESLTAFAETQLTEEQQGMVFEYYSYYLKNVRPLELRDLIWVRRWIASGSHVYGLMALLARSHIPYSELESVVLALGRSGDGFIRATSKSLHDHEDVSALSKFAVHVVKTPVFRELSDDARVWFAEMARGQTPAEALAVLTKAHRAKLYKRPGPDEVT